MVPSSKQVRYCKGQLNLADGHFSTGGENKAIINHTRSFHLGMLLHKKPAHVSEEETSRGVVWVCVFLGVLVMHPVIPRPVVDGALVCQGGIKHQKHSDNAMCLVGAMRPHRMKVWLDSSGIVGWQINEIKIITVNLTAIKSCLLYTSPSPRDATLSRMPSSA